MILDGIKEGQTFYDQPVYLNTKPLGQIEQAVATAFRHELPQALFAGYEHVTLRWLKPDGKGGFAPR